MDGTGLVSTRAIEAMSACASRGTARVAFRQRGGVTHLADLRQQSPLRVLFPNSAETSLPLAVMVNTSGGLVGGDHLETEIALGDGAAALVTAQAAEKVYRSAGAETRVDNRLSAAAGAWLEWLPQETILFDRCRLRRTLRIDVAPGALVLAGEILVFGRIARGEQVIEGLVHDSWEIYRDGRLVWADALHLDGHIGTVLSNPLCFGRARSYATLVYVGDDASARLELIRARLPEDIASGATCHGSLVVARFLAADATRLRRAFGRLWIGLRREIGGRAATLPPIWHI